MFSAERAGRLPFWGLAQVVCSSLSFRRKILAEYEYCVYDGSRKIMKKVRMEG